MPPGGRSEATAVGAVGAAGLGFVALGLAGLVAGAGPLLGVRAAAATLGGLVALVAAASFALGASHGARSGEPLRAGRHVLAPVLVACIFAAGGAALLGAESATAPLATAGDEPVAPASDAPAASGVPVAVEPFRGRLAGARLPLAGHVSASDASREFNLILPREATSARVELAWAARPGGADELSVLVRLKDAYGEWETVADVAGPPMIWIDLAKTPGASAPLQIVVGAPEGSAVLDQPFEGFASAFVGPVPRAYSAAQ